ncbi:MAG: hypothetical protein IKJ18_07385 [Bacteroidaceae bacterium]|nr:hypothetical protein [Bacteroidaceae bacterium]
MKKLFVKAIDWLMAALQQVKVKSCMAAVNSDDAAGEGLRDNDKPGPYPLPLRVLPLPQRESANIANGEMEAINSKEEPLILRMEEFVAERYEVRYNRLAQQYELSRKGTEQWQRLDDEACCRLLMEMNRGGIAVAKPYLVRTVVQGGTLARMYHPVCSYLEKLPEWDGVGHIEALFRRVTDDERLLAWLRKWFLAMVAQVMGRMGTYGNSVCPILISARQGWGKSQFAKMLVPPRLRVFYTDTFNLAQEDACLRRMTAYMLVNVDEVDRFKETRMATFKNLVQLSAVSMKRAYRSQMEEKERMASFIATSNRRCLLHDESGSRRFICVELTRPIDVEAPIDYDQLYAEAVAALDRGECCWFDEEETRQLEAHNADYSARRGVWDLLNRHFAVCDIPEGTEERLDTLWPATEVYDYLHDLSPSSMAGIERTGFAHYLKRMGAQQVRVKNRRLYGVVQRG